MQFGRAFFSTLLFAGATAALAHAQDSWRYYRPGNTGIQGDYCETLWIGPDGDPWIGGYDPSFEEGGIAKLVQAENRWINVSSVDYPVFGHPSLTGSARVGDIEIDAAGTLWMGTWRGVLTMDPAVGGSSLVNLAGLHPALLNGGCHDLEISPDGAIWFALSGFGSSQGGLMRHRPSDGSWTYWTGGGTPSGGNNWPPLVWSVASIDVQPKPGGGYLLWCDSANGSAIVVFDSTTGLFTYHESTFTPGSYFDLPGKEATDDAGNLWMKRFSHFQGSAAVYSLDVRRPDGTWFTPAQPPGPGIAAFRARGDLEALAVDDAGRVWRFRSGAWNDLGLWRPGSFTYDVDADEAGNVWVCGIGGAAKREDLTGQWQRYRVTNTSQFDTFNADLTVAPDGRVWACANAGPGVGGMVQFDGERWVGFNQAHYGLGHDWPFPTDNSQEVLWRPSTGNVVTHPTFNGLHSWDGSKFSALLGGTSVRDLTEDSLGRLWFVGEYFDLRVHDGNAWTQVGIVGWGNRIQRDPSRAGTVWAATAHEVVRTDGAYRFSRGIEDFPALSVQSDTFSGLAVGPDGVAWIGATVQFGSGGSGGALIRIDPESGTAQFLRHDQGWPFPGQFVSPLAVTPDGRLWMQYDSDFLTAQRGLCWYDGTDVGVFPAPAGGEPQWGGLPHAQIEELVVREIAGGYELWMSCISRGIAVLTHVAEEVGEPFCLGDGSAADCPCGPTQNGAAGEGCLHSFGTGATLRATGTVRVSSDSLRLSAAGLPATITALFFQYEGTAAPAPFGDGLVCASGSVTRLRAVVATNGLAAIGAGTTPPLSQLGSLPPAGGLRHYQVWYRNQQGFCTPASFNSSAGVAIDWLP